MAPRAPSRRFVKSGPRGPRGGGVAPDATTTTAGGTIKVPVDTKFLGVKVPTPGGIAADIVNALRPILKIGAGGFILLVAGTGIVATGLASTKAAQVAAGIAPTGRALKAGSRAVGVGKAASSRGRRVSPPAKAAGRGRQTPRPAAHPERMSAAEFRRRTAAGESFKVKAKGKD